MPGENSQVSESDDDLQSTESRGPQLQAVVITMLTLAVTSMLLRIMVRLRIVRIWGIDDSFMLVATMTYIMFATCALGGIHYGTGQHMDSLPAWSSEIALKYWWLCYVAYCLTMITVKISIGLFLLRIAIKRVYTWIIWAVMAFSIISGGVFFFVTLLQCRPLEYFWTRANGGTGTCLDIEIIIGLTYLYGAVSTVTDFTFGLLPIFLVWNLNMDRRMKWALVPVLSIACVASAGPLVRMAYVKDFKNPDFLWATVDIAIWSDTEQGLAIFAGNLPTLRPLYSLIVKGTMSGSRKRSGTPGNPYVPNKTWHNDSKNKRKGAGDGAPWSLLQTENGEPDYEMGHHHHQHAKVDSRDSLTSVDHRH